MTLLAHGGRRSSLNEQVRTPRLDIFRERGQRTDIDFMKGNARGALLENLDSANGVEELTATMESLP